MRLLPFAYAVRNLGRSPSRLFLSVAGAAMVVLLILVAGGFVNGMSRALRATGGEHNVILMGAGSEESVERSEIEAGVPGVLAASVAGVRTRAGVAYVSPEVHVMLPVRVGAAARTTTQSSGEQAAAAQGSNTASMSKPKGRQVMMRGVTPTAALVHESVSLTEGRWPVSGADEVLVGRMAATVLGVAEIDVQVGKAVMIDGRPWEVVGRFSAPGTVVEAEVWLPLADLMTATKRETISCVVLTLDPYNEETGEGADFGDIAAFTKTRPDLELVPMTEREYYGKLANFFGPIKIVAWVTAGLIAVGGLFGGLNTMYAAFASRIRELGTLQSIGYRRLAIVWSMIQESTLATAAGGLIACAVGVFMLDGLAVRFSMGAFGLMIDETVIGLGLLTGLALGVVGALPPAIRCLKPTIPVALKAV
ncbi:MAG: ABC transporter permease [Phycisphaerales bacterium]|jgi:putative ABC transport system permease protein|nr:ABC transporter permease [Phycisphaeraceae bacterium]